MDLPKPTEFHHNALIFLLLRFVKLKLGLHVRSVSCSIFKNIMNNAQIQT